MAISYRIRSAHPRDLPEIIAIGRSAFTQFSVFGPPYYDDAAVLPALLSSMSNFKWPNLRLIVPNYALKPKALAYALWTEYPMRIRQKTIRCLNLAPLAVLAAHHNQGLGGLLMRDGIRMAHKQGINLISILGHTAYYPRFGLQTGIFGHSGIEIPIQSTLQTEADLPCIRPVIDGDVPILEQLFTQLRAQENGLYSAEKGLAPWLSATKGIYAAVLEKNGIVTAYARFDARAEAQGLDGVLNFLAADQNSAQEMIAFIVSKTNWHGILRLPLSAKNPAVLRLFPQAQSFSEPMDAGMAMVIKDCPVDSNTSLQRFIELVQAGQEPALNGNYPPLFDF